MIDTDGDFFYLHKKFLVGKILYVNFTCIYFHEGVGQWKTCTFGRSLSSRDNLLLLMEDE